MRFLIIILLLLGLSAYGVDYYVATNGNDGWSGRTPQFVSGTTGPKLTLVQGCNLLNATGGDTLNIEGGLYVNAYGAGSVNVLRLRTVYGSQATPTVITNYPNALSYSGVTLTNSDINSPALDIEYCSWVKIFGITITNAYRSADLEYITNCEVANCTFGGTNNSQPNLGSLAPFVMYNNAQSNWIHNNLVLNAPVTNYTDSSHGLSVGQFFSTTDVTDFNIIESNTVFHTGHDCISIYGQHNVVRYNFTHNEPWFFRIDILANGGARSMEVGGGRGDHNVIEHNRLQHAGINNTGGSHSIEVDGPQLNIIRNNEMLCDDYGAFAIYSTKNASYAGAYQGSNYVYNNTMFNSGWITNPIAVYNINSNFVGNTDNSVWQNPVVIFYSTNNFFVNNIIYSNNTTYATINGHDGATNVIRNANNPTNDPSFVDPTDGGPFSTAQPNTHLLVGSAAIDSGTWLTTANGGGSGTTMTVGDANYFFAGLTAAGRTLPGDTIQLQGQTTTATITGISGNVLTLNASLTWTNGQGVALPYNGTAPDVGAFEYTGGGGSTSGWGYPFQPNK